ncbi:MAG: DUF5343 domain-containing protein [Chloroflexi bacterium]|nr:DUF5343 domain-containing protein [Chloroflexota bacterium]
MNQQLTEPPRGPYAPVQNVLAVMERVRDRGLPEVITADTLGAIGVPPGNRARTLVALRFLGLIDAENRRTAAMERIARAGQDDYASLLAEVLREAYAPVFLLVDPSEDDEIKIGDAFRQYEPAAQRQKMITLFLGLCVEAQLVSRKAQRRSPTPETRQQRRPRATEQVVDAGESSVSVLEGADLRGIQAAVQQLPRSGEWTLTERERWLTYFTGTLDYAMRIVDGNGESEA